MSIKILSPASITKQFRSIHQEQRQSTIDKNQQLINLLKLHSKIRESSINFMFKACSKYKFRKDTLFLAVKLMDILVEKKFVPFIIEAQLVSACLILIATKFNEVYPVTIDQLTLIMQKYNQRELFLKTEGQILQCINYQMPEYTIFSQLYNQLESILKQQKSTDSDKQNDQYQNNLNKIDSKTVQLLNEKKLTQKTLKVIKQPECFKYGQNFLFHALLSYIKNIKTKGISVNVVKMNYLKTVLKKIFEPENSNKILSDSLSAQSRLMPPKSPKLNPQIKIQRKLKFLIF